MTGYEQKYYQDISRIAKSLDKMANPNKPTIRRLGLMDQLNEIYECFDLIDCSRHNNLGNQYAKEIKELMDNVNDLIDEVNG